ncbi:MAG: glycoside hydrolase family protein [Akkermansiaceae bacterium]|nr:glycoside hydrolase family protein [Akkermansiaceae bacterium]
MNLLQLFLIPLLAASPLAAAPAPPAPRKTVVAYVPNWIDLKSYAGEIDYGRLTHLNLAFENPVDDSGQLSFKASNQFVIDRAKEKKVKVLISIGGGSASDDPVLKPRYQMLMSPEKRKDFAAKLSEYVVSHGLDGIDVDIEGPSIGDDYGPFIEELSALLKPKGKLLTAALSKGYGGDRVPDSTLKCYDFLNIMAYDATGPWSPDQPGQHSSLQFAGSCVDYWLSRGLPKEKAVLGVPFYGYGFGDNVTKRNFGYNEIVAAFPGSEQQDQAGTTIWYNGIPTMKAKARLVMERQLAGVMIWSLNCDAEGEASLLTTLDSVLREKTPPVKK